MFNHTVLREDLSVRKSEGQIAESLQRRRGPGKEGSFHVGQQWIVLEAGSDEN